MHWILLITAGLFEIGFTTFMKLSAGFSKWPYTIGFIVCAMISFDLLTRSLQTIPLGTAYAVWTGIGAVGTAAIGMLFFSEPVSFIRTLLLLTLIGSVIGLKFTSV